MPKVIKRVPLYSLQEWAKLKGITIERPLYHAHKVARICFLENRMVGKTENGRNAYPEDILEHYFKEQDAIGQRL